MLAWAGSYLEQVYVCNAPMDGRQAFPTRSGVWRASLVSPGDSSLRRVSAGRRLAGEGGLRKTLQAG